MAQMDVYHRAEQVVECLEVTLDSGVTGEARDSKARRNAIQRDGEFVLEAEIGDNMITALDNLENAAVEKNGNVERLVIANKALTDSLVDRDAECDRLLTIITALSTGRGTSGSSGDGKPPWEPDGYCCSHGYKVRTGHSSATCHCQSEGNKDPLDAKRGDIQGGCVWNLSWKAKNAGSDS